MMFSIHSPRLHPLLATIALCFAVQPLQADSFNAVVIRTGSAASAVEQNIANLLVSRLRENDGVAARAASEASGTTIATGDLVVLLGTLEHHHELAHLLATRRIPQPTTTDPGPEGFLLRLVVEKDVPTLIAAGVDMRGCLYAVGEMLRRATVRRGSVTFPSYIDVRTAPAFEIRGTQYGQSHVAKTLAHVRDWTNEETKRVVLDYALAGANVFAVGSSRPMFDFVKSYGLMAQRSFGANTGGDPNHPEWNARESIGRKGFVCLSVPEARAYMLRKCESVFKDSPSYDFVKFHGGDGGGCECDRCDPYGNTFIRVVEEMAGIIHRYHPATRVYFTNQKFDNADDQAIFAYLRDKPRRWLWAWGYGPGSDATTWQPGHRQTHRMDLFRYPGFGPYGLYPKEILHQLPPHQVLVYYNEITHWEYSQHGYIQMYPRADRNGDLPPHWSREIYQRRPDQALTMVYNRLTFYAWPRYYHRVFNDLLRYGVGDITHSSGHHDHFNQWLWQRLLWAPRTRVEDVVDEYCRTWFGREGAPAMAQAIFQLEENIEEQPGVPLAEKRGIERYCALVRRAGERMPSRQMRGNWLWRMYMQKGLLDRYVQLAVRQQVALQKAVETRVAGAIGTAREQPAVAEALGLFSTLVESARMKRLRAEAGHLGDESNALFGVRSEGYFNLEHDFVGLGWLKRQLTRAQAARAADRRELLSMIVDYDNPGEGGQYDNMGTANVAPNVVFGYPYDHGQPYVSQMLSEGNRPSQRSMHFTQDEEQGVKLQYGNLDPNANYRLRLTLVRPWFQKRYRMRMNQKSESIFADGKLLAKDVELPERMSDFFTFNLPREVTRDGHLEIRFMRADDVARGDRVSREQWRNCGGWGTMVSEAWLIKTP